MEISFAAQLRPRRSHFKLRESSPNFALTMEDSFAPPRLTGQESRDR
jgi:hypothetical protein